MFKPIYKNSNTGKLYCFDTDEATGETKIFTAYVDDYDKAGEYKVDKKGKPYKVFDVELGETKKGFKVYRKVKVKE